MNGRVSWNGLICLGLVAIAIGFWVAEHSQPNGASGKPAPPRRVIVSERGCDYIQLNDWNGNPIQIIEAADQPSTCKYNVLKKR